MSPTADYPNPPSSPSEPPRPSVLEETDWKLQRKLKHQQRDAGRRTAEGRMEPLLKPRFKSHVHHQSRVDVMRLEKDAWLPTPAKSARRNIPERRRGEKAMSGGSRAVLLSQSGPSAVSWPLTAGAPAPDGDDETIDANWGFRAASNAEAELASSAPNASSSSRRFESKREARPMTLFESARIFNESGQLLSHDNFDELGSSPEMAVVGTPKRKFKRRVGRRKNERKWSDAVDALNADEVVLELMCLLFPDVEVANELNLLLLGSGQQHDDVFHFDEDDIVDIPPATAVPGGVLDIDLLKFQATLTTMLFAPSTSLQEMPVRGTSAETLLELYIRPQWLSQQVLSMVKLDVLAQYDHFAVVIAIFRAIPDMRSCILDAATSASLAIFQHQGLVEAVPMESGKELVSVKGLIAFLNAALAAIEKDAQYSPGVFGSSDEQINDTIGELCSQIMCAVRLLARSSPGGTRRADESRNQLEKYAECSDSTEATTYRALGDVIYRMAAFSPIHGEEFLSWMLLKWPQRNVQLQLFFVRFTAGLLTQFMQHGLVFPAEVVRRAFGRIRACIQSPHFLVAQEACNLCGNLQLMDMYLSRDQALREKIASALHESSTSHWNKRIREISDEYFDMLLDLA
ncbi:hypothetical protein BBJ28_00011720 [Nothophytophthora sp. Chile5]|nr:hypothetical protein BBJ28_00011720 [Nothophytophthora sp. Chile5]